MYSEFSAGDVISAVNESLPAPKNPFERALYFKNLKWIAGELAVFYKREYNDLIELIKDEPSDEYRIVMSYQPRSYVNSEKLRELRPDIYSQISYVDANTAVMILSRGRLHDLCREAAGPENIHRYESVNKGDLEKVMTAGDAAEFIETVLKPAGYVVEAKV